MDELTLFGNVVENAERITTRQLAKQLGTSPKVVLENAKKCLPHKKIENGKPTYWSKAEVTVVLDWMKNHDGNHSSDLYFESKGALTTELTPALKIKKAMELMREGYEEELTILRERNAVQAAKITEDAPKVEFYERVISTDGLTNFRDTAKELRVGEKAFIQWLIDEGYLYRTATKELRYFSGCDKWFALKECTGGGVLRKQVLVTNAGKAHFAKICPLATRSV